MKASGFTTWMARIDAAEYGLCRTLNRGVTYALVRRVFQVASRLGDQPMTGRAMTERTLQIGLAS